MTMTNQEPEDRTAVLMISGYSSRCGRCRGGTKPTATRHLAVVDGNPERRQGCGALFTAVSTDQLGPARSLAAVAQQRPDLPIVIPEWMTIPGHPAASDAEAVFQVALDDLRTAVEAHRDSPSEELLQAGRASWERVEAAGDVFDQIVRRLRREAGPV
jgi:hypothetical protein